MSQFRIHDSNRVHVYLHIPSHPIIEDCQNMVFGTYPFSLTQSDHDLSGLEKDVNQFEHVEDFNWHKKTASPHWSLADPQSRNQWPQFEAEGDLSDAQLQPLIASVL